MISNNVWLLDSSRIKDLRNLIMRGAKTHLGYRDALQCSAVYTNGAHTDVTATQPPKLQMG